MSTPNRLIHFIGELADLRPKMRRNAFIIKAVYNLQLIYGYFDYLYWLRNIIRTFEVKVNVICLVIQK